MTNQRIVDTSDRYDAMSKLLPTPDRDNARYFAGLASGELRLQRCAGCDKLIWPARPICNECHGTSLKWETVPATGSVYSWIVNHHVLLPELAPHSPYTVALVALDASPDILIPGWLLNANDREPAQGMRVSASFERYSESIGLMHWRSA
jgi:uncharacterized OB-fold protein